MFKILFIGGILITSMIFNGCGDSKNNQLANVEGTYD